MSWRSASDFLSDRDERELDAEVKRTDQRLDRVRRRTEMEMAERAAWSQRAVEVGLDHELDVVVYMVRDSYRFLANCICGWRARRGAITRQAAERSYDIHLNPGR